MTKSYPELLGEWVRRRESTKRDKNVVAFLAVRDDVGAALAAGFAVTTIWANMHENRRVAFGYDTFLNYVNRYIRCVGAQPEMVEAPRSSAAPSKARRTPPGPTDVRVDFTTAPGTIPGFTFNSAPRKEDLI